MVACETARYSSVYTGSPDMSTTMSTLPDTDDAADELDDDMFEDAVEELPRVGVVPKPAPVPSLTSTRDAGLDSSLEDARRAVTYFFNNQFEEAKLVLRPHAETSLYHSLGTAVFAFLEAALTFQQDHVKNASDQLRNCVNVCESHRRKVSITEAFGKMVKRPNYNTYTAIEMHAELCYAEALLLKSLLTFVEDETLMTFIKAGLKIRSCYNSYKECNDILNYRDWDNEAHKVHFDGGVRMGIGTFNLMISLLPPRIIKLLEFIGFGGNKDLGLIELEKGFALHQSLRQVLCVMTLLAYHLIVTYILSRSDGDLGLCDRILQQQLAKYPKGVWFLFFKGRLEYMRGNLDEASSWYVRSWHSQDVWPHFHHMAFWELMFVNCVRMDWRQADEYAELLQKHSRWSRTIYSYQQACILMMLPRSATSPDSVKIDELLSTAPRWKQRIAGKSLPMEKFAVKKSERYFAQKKSLVLPAIELIYVWNLFKVLGKKRSLSEPMLKLIKETEKSLDEGYVGWASGQYASDNRALVLLLKGALLSATGNFLQAEESLKKVIALERKLSDDHYVVPYAYIELASIAHKTGDSSKALSLIDNARKNYTGYSLESRLHFQMHSLSMEVMDGKRSSNSENPTADYDITTHL